MELAALGFWIATALGGIYMMGVLIRTGRDTSSARATRLPSLVVFTHGSLALLGLAVWAVYMTADERSLAWGAFAVLVVVAALGSFMFVRWQMDRLGSEAEVAAKKEKLAEQQIPSMTVHGHGALAFVTIVLVLLVALGV